MINAKKDNKLNDEKKSKTETYDYIFKHKNIIKDVLYFIGFIALVYFIFSQKAVQQNLIKYLNILKNKGNIGKLILIIISVIVSIITNNHTIGNLCIGYLYGIKEGYLINIVIVFMVGIVGYFMGNKIINKKINKELDTNPDFKTLKKIKEAEKRLTSKEQIEISLLTRLPPINPYVFISYFWGITDIKLNYYIIGLLGVLPSLLFETYLGSKMKHLGDIFKSGINMKHIAEFSVLLGITIIISVYIVHFVKKKLNKTINNSDNKKNKK